jgi:hypothetical protein
LPHCSAVGKALLAQMPREEAKAILRRLGMPRRTAHTVTSVAAFLGELDRVVREGYAVDDEEDTEGVSCVAACVFDRGGKAAGAISVTGLKPRDWSRRKNLLAQAVKPCAARISQRLGPWRAESRRGYGSVGDRRWYPGTLLMGAPGVVSTSLHASLRGRPRATPISQPARKSAIKISDRIGTASGSIHLPRSRAA